MAFRRNRIRKIRRFWQTDRKSTNRADKWPAWKKDVEVARYVSLLK
ncbi:MAG: hypothetical protein ACQES5_08515 [Thermodesulfobacteriota bacterium]